ncbi:ABC transporter substrate-binding protein [Pseudomonas mangiferae]|uniref:Amino acid ABC transporter substrate-binding protein n=1 Tax=Pseudomonas mangiferae TaxID=2593654 RepID=A0A553GXD6_9PSED|nr:ABC transporter substrate-binding protein [Pseudomonas mangiferae]TRX74168.1 amino acid ABC transporter substrate-binding protein [Pseudomonas mangiferae]
MNNPIDLRSRAAHPHGETRRRPAWPFAALVLAGAVLAQPAWAKDAIKVCFVDDRSGAAADTGIQSYNGFQLALAEVNAAGGIAGHPVEAVAYDGKTDPQLTATFASRCAEDDGALAIVGGNPAAPAAAMIPIATEYEIPYLMLSAGTDNLTDAPAPFHFRVGPRNSQDANAIAGLVSTQGFKRVAIINNSLPFGTDSAHAALAALKAKNIEVVAQQTYDINATDLAPQVSTLRNAKPDVVLVFPYAADGARVLRTLQQLGMQTPRIVARSALLSTLRDLAGAASDGVLIPNTVDIHRDDVKRLFEAYKARFGAEQPTMYPVLGYDAAKLVFKALAEPKVLAALDDGELAAARVALRDAIVANGHYAGLQGRTGATYQFSESQRHGPPDDNWFVFVQVTGNGKQLVDADLAAFTPTP